MILSDKDIIKYFTAGKSLVVPFAGDKQVTKGISWGLSSAGYDIRIADKWITFNNPYSLKSASIIDTHDFSNLPSTTREIIQESLVIKPGETVLGVSVEYFNIPSGLMGICVGRSTLARLGILVNTTPLEPGWSGFLTIEITNLNRNRSIRIHANEGIAQVLFMQTSSLVQNIYGATGQGQYQNQAAHPVLPTSPKRGY